MECFKVKLLANTMVEKPKLTLHKQFSFLYGFWKGNTQTKFGVTDVNFV